MFTIWSVIRWIHLLAAIAWIGGMLFIVLVLMPVLRSALPTTERTLLFARVGRRYGTLSWISLTLLVVTGFLNGERRGIRWTHLLDSDYGQTLALKLLLVAIVIVITLIHAIFFGPRITALAERARILDVDGTAGSSDSKRLQVASIALSAVNLLLNLIIVLLAASLVA